MESSFLKYTDVEVLLALPGWTIIGAHPGIWPVEAGQVLALAKFTGSALILRTTAGEDEHELKLSNQQLRGIVTDGEQLIIYGIENPHGSVYAQKSVCWLILTNPGFRPADAEIQVTEGLAEEAAAAKLDAAGAVVEAYNAAYVSQHRATIVISGGQTFVDLPGGIRLTVGFQPQ
jgi:hypothetical protein